MTNPAVQSAPGGADPLDFHAIVEILGHKKLAGRVTQVAIGSAAMLRVDVPKTAQRDAYTKYVGVASVYAMTPVEEGVAQRAAEQIERYFDPLPVSFPAALPAGDATASSYDADESDDEEYDALESDADETTTEDVELEDNEELARHGPPDPAEGMPL